MKWVLGLLALAFVSGPGYAESLPSPPSSACGPLETITEYLASHGEKIKLTAVDDFDNPVRFYASKDGTFSIVRVQEMSNGSGFACIIMSGKSLRQPSKKDARRLLQLG